MKRMLFYILRLLAFVSRMFNNQWYMKLMVEAHQSQGVQFIGTPNYIQYDAYLDPSGGLTIHHGTVISTKVTVLTHDWSFLVRKKAQNIDYSEEECSKAFSSVEIGEHSFVGAGAIILPGSKIGKYCIIGAGAVVKGTVADYSIMAGNPAKLISSIKSLQTGGHRFGSAPQSGNLLCNSRSLF